MRGGWRDSALWDRSNITRLNSFGTSVMTLESRVSCESGHVQKGVFRACWGSRLLSHLFSAAVQLFSIRLRN